MTTRLTDRIRKRWQDERVTCSALLRKYTVDELIRMRAAISQINAFRPYCAKSDSAETVELNLLTYICNGTSPIELEEVAQKMWSDATPQVSGKTEFQGW